VVPLARLKPDRWGMLLDRARELGLAGVAVDLVWRVYERPSGRLEWTGARDLGRFLALAAERGLGVLVRLGPCFPREPGLGLPERILADARLRSAGPLWAPSPPRLVPLPELACPAFQAELKALWEAAARAFLAWGPPAGPLLGLALEPWALEPWARPSVELAGQLTALVRACFPGLPVLLGLPAAGASPELARLADGLGLVVRHGRAELTSLRSAAASLLAAGRPGLALPLASGASWAEAPRALDDLVCGSLAAQMLGVGGFVLEALVERPGFVGAPVRRDATLEPERADWVRRLTRLAGHLPPFPSRAEAGLPRPDDPSIEVRWQAAPEVPFGAGPGVLWLVNPGPGERTARLELPRGARAWDLWRQAEHAGAGLEIGLPPFALRPLEVLP
jgi:hypothetical protein